MTRICKECGKIIHGLALVIKPVDEDEPLFVVCRDCIKKGLRHGFSEDTAQMLDDYPIEDYLEVCE